MLQLKEPVNTGLGEERTSARSARDRRVGDPSDSRKGQLSSYARWMLTGMLLVGFHLLLFWISPKFDYTRNELAKPVPILVVIESLAGLLYLFTSRFTKNSPDSRFLLAWVVAVGLIMRVSMLTSTPMLEDDYYRYLWDGGVLAGGFNPYSYAPSEVLNHRDTNSTPDRLHELAGESGAIIERINHPHLGTIYPPIAQAVFAFSHWLGPWNLTIWRLILLVIDSATLYLLIVTLRTLNLPILFSLIYWWNPLVIKEIFNSAHMDVIALPFVLGALLLSVRHHHYRAVSLLAFAVGVKIWPVVLLPLILRPIWGDRRQFIPALILFVLLSAALFYPVYSAGLENDSGFSSYGRYWEMNDALYMLFLWLSRGLLNLTGLGAGQDQLLARVLVGTVLAVWIGHLVREKANTPIELYENSLLVVAAVFLLSPTQFPWYYVWILPLLAIRPRASLLLLTPLLSLYYLRFYFEPRGNVGIFDNGIVWLEFIPVWFLLIREWMVQRNPSSTSQPEGVD
ncbi:MAG: glycosyltransferase family 87 protein [bacterium]